MQVAVLAQDRRYLRCLWTNSENEEPEGYEYQRLFLEQMSHQLEHIMHYSKLHETTRLSF